MQREGKTHRLAFESVYSLLQKQGGVLDHETTLRQLIERISTARLQFAQTDFVIEWVKRDLLNIAFGNSDNHGRNMAFYVMNNVFGSPQFMILRRCVLIQKALFVRLLGKLKGVSTGICWRVSL